MLTIRQLSVAYGSTPVVQDVDLDLHPGVVLGLIGPNGAGKTSLIRAISGVAKPSGGKIEIDGVDLLSLSEMERAKLISVVPQSTQLPPAFTVWECVALGRTPHLNWLGNLEAADRAKIEWALQVTGVEALKDRRAGQLSGGEQQRVLLARSLAQDCPILLMDEPTAHLDLHHQVGILTLVRQMAREKQLAVLVAMHDLNLASLFTDRLALLVKGRIQSIGTPEQVLTLQNLQQAYQVPLNIVPNPQHDSPWVAVRRQ
jgi:iron complex transport system ATP-binding protein